MTTWRRNTQRLALLSVLAASCLAIQLTPRLPNVEFTSFFTFIVGISFGALYGSLFGCSIMFANGFLSPYGYAGLNMPFQMIGMAMAGVLGGAYRKLMPTQLDSARFCVETGIVGAVIALFYDLLTNLGFALQLVFSGADVALAIFSTIAYGVFFSAIHIFTNTTVFGILTLPSTRTLNNLMGHEKIG